jgi:hypothetical protein
MGIRATFFLVSTADRAAYIVVIGTAETADEVSTRVVPIAITILNDAFGTVGGAVNERHTHDLS